MSPFVRSSGDVHSVRSPWNSHFRGYSKAFLYHLFWVKIRSPWDHYFDLHDGMLVEQFESNDIEG